MTTETNSEFLAAWESSGYGAWAESLLSDGYEGLLLRPLATVPERALELVEWCRVHDSHRQRKVAASLTGYLGAQSPESLLDDLFSAERRRALAEDDVWTRALCSSVVEDIVFAAARWCRSPERRHAGIEVSRRVVEDELTSQVAWNVASYAMCTLTFHEADGVADLLDRFVEFAAAEPHRVQEQEFAAGLASAAAETVAAIETMLDENAVHCDAYANNPEIAADVRAFMALVDPEPAPELEERWVSHPKFGRGVVIATQSRSKGEKLTIRFDDGEERKLLDRFVEYE